MAGVVLSLVTVMASECDGVAMEVHLGPSKLAEPEPANSWASEKSDTMGLTLEVKTVGVTLAVWASPFALFSYLKEPRAQKYFLSISVAKHTASSATSF